MTRSVRGVDWAALGASVGSAVLFTLLSLAPLLMGVHGGYWLVGLAMGTVLGVYMYIRRERYQEPGPDADEQRFRP